MSKENLSGPHGVIILSVLAEGPAAQAGLVMGDIVLSVDGQTVGSTKDLKSILAKKIGGQTVVLELIRKDAVAKIELTLSDWPQ